MGSKIYATLFHLTGGRSLQVNLSQDVAHGYLTAWTNNALPGFIGETNVAGPWGIKTSEIVAIQLMDIEDLMKLQGQQGTRPQQPLLGPSYYDKSGRN